LSVVGASISTIQLAGLAAFVVLIRFKTPLTAPRVQATPRDKILQIDLPGAALVISASLCLLLALQYGEVTHPWKSSIVVGLLVGFGLIVVALIIVEIWQDERAMLTPRFMRKRAFWVISVWPRSICLILILRAILDTLADHQTAIYQSLMRFPSDTRL
jgi:hypothetical protein